MLLGSAKVSARKAISGLIRPFSIRNRYILFWVSIDTYIHGLVGWKSRWRGPNSLPPFGAIDTSFFRTPLLYSKTFRAPGSSALVGVPSLPRVTSTASLLSGVVRI